MYKIQCIMTTKLAIRLGGIVCVFRTVILPKARKCIIYHIPTPINTLPLQITAKLYTHTQIGFVNNTKQLFLNGYSSNCLVENCYVGLCRCVETSFGFEVFHLFFL